MPQTALMGPDGQQAKDMRGMPLTMEEMLRRNGIVAMGNNISMLGPQADPANNALVNSSVASTDTPQSATAATMLANANGASGSPNPAIAVSTSPATANTPATPSVEELAASNADPATIDALEGLGLLAAGTGAAYLAYRGLQGRANANANDSTPSNAIIDGTFSEVDEPRRVGSSTARQLQRNATKRLGSPTKSLPAPNNRSATAKAVADRAARGGPTDVGTIVGQPPIQVLREAPEAGVARTLGMDSKLVQVLKNNPGLLRILTRGR